MHVPDFQLQYTKTVFQSNNFMLTDMTKEQMKPFPSYLWTDVMYEPDLKFFYQKREEILFYVKYFGPLPLELLSKC